jgi:hypothetical protein
MLHPFAVAVGEGLIRVVVVPDRIEDVILTALDQIHVEIGVTILFLAEQNGPGWFRNLVELDRGPLPYRTKSLKP